MTEKPAPDVAANEVDEEKIDMSYDLPFTRGGPKDPDISRRKEGRLDGFSEKVQTKGVGKVHKEGDPIRMDPDNLHTIGAGEGGRVDVYELERQEEIEKEKIIRWKKLKAALGDYAVNVLS